MVADLRVESDELDAIVADLPADQWAEATPAPGWTIAHQIAHLLWTDRVALTAVTDEVGFAAVLAEAAKDPTGFVDEGAEELALLPPKRLLTEWREIRSKLHGELLVVADGRKLPWFGPPMSAASMATARLMETWAHGLDVADALEVERPATGPFRVELGAPDGTTWSWGPDDAGERVTGSAEDFCMLVTQRRPRSALDVDAVGDDAEKWLGIAQAFAGPPGAGRGYSSVAASALPSPSKSASLTSHVPSPSVST
jgi:uncharacterized protein (TIGR03083 family)